MLAYDEPMAPKKPSPDELLATENYRELNRTFYAAKPQDYFSHRLQNLILVAGKREGLDRLMAEGVEFGDLKAPPAATANLSVAANGAASDDSDKEAEAAKAAEHFVIAEAEVLAQHVGETLLRLYLAHEFAAGAAPPDCPWLEISRLRSFSQFKNKVRARFDPERDPDDPTHLGAIARVFHLTDNPTSMSESAIPDDEWNRSLRNIEGYLRGFAHEFLDRAALYNAAKHGLALRPSEMKMRYGDGKVVSAEGPIIQYLEIREQDGVPRWSQVNHWVKPDRQMALIFRACQLIERLWDVARLRYLPEQQPNRFELRLMAGPSWEDLRYSSAKDGGGFVVEDMAVGLIYYMPPGGREGSNGDEAP